MTDNASAHPAADYETEVRRTIPFPGDMLRLAVEVALGARPAPERWLDTGAGPGVLVERARAKCPGAEYWVADPSEAMRALAAARLGLPGERVLAFGSADLPEVGPFDVITAVQCHHYGDMVARERAVRRCLELLAPGGALVVFENVRAESERGQVLQRARWAEWQRDQGRDDETVKAHLAREGSQFFPIRVSQHLGLFAHLGFETVELVWRAYGQAGFLAVR